LFQIPLDLSLPFTGAAGKFKSINTSTPALAKDFDPELGVLSLITSDRRFIRLLINGSDQTSEAVAMSKYLSECAELDSEGGTTFGTFARTGNYWVFGNDLRQSKQVNLLVYG